MSSIVARITTTLPPSGYFQMRMHHCIFPRTSGRLVWMCRRVRAAILEEEGMIEIVHGWGSFVRKGGDGH